MHVTTPPPDPHGTSGPEEGGSYLGLLRRNRGFTLLYGATLISLAGDWFLTVALLDLVLELTGSATLASLLTLCATLPVFFATPLVGPLVDRLPRQRLMIAMDLLRAGAALLPMLAQSTTTLPLAFFGIVVISLGSSMFDPAAEAALPNLVAPADLSRANVLLGSTWGTMLVVGSSLGGLVALRFGRSVAFGVDSATFLISALMIARVRGPFAQGLGGAAAAHGGGAAEGIGLFAALSYARRHPQVLLLLLCKGGYGLGSGVVSLLSVFGREIFRQGPAGIGTLYAARGAGALLGPFLLRALIRDERHQYRAIGLCIALFGLGYAGLSLSPQAGIGWAALTVGVAHLGGGAQWQISTYGLQRLVPDRLRGRIFAADYGLLTLTMGLSSVSAGFAADRLGPVTAVLGAASLAVLWGAVFTALSFRLFRRLPQGELE